MRTVISWKIHSTCRHCRKKLNSGSQEKLLNVEINWVFIVLTQILKLLTLILHYYHERS